MPVERDPQKLSTKERSQLNTRGWRDRRPGELPLVCADVRPSDYVSEFARGAVAWVPETRNYAYHTVTIPDGTTVRNTNFSQAVPNTAAIIGANLTFIDCNLANVRHHATWTLQGCNTSQAWVVEIDHPSGRGKRQERQYIASHPKDLPVTLIPPANALGV